MSSAASGRPVEILLVEDNPGDVRLTRETLKESKLLNKMIQTFLYRLPGLFSILY